MTVTKMTKWGAALAALFFLSNATAQMCEYTVLQIEPFYTTPEQACYYFDIDGSHSPSGQYICDGSATETWSNTSMKCSGPLGVWDIKVRSVPAPPPPPNCVAGNLSEEFFSNTTPPSYFCDGECEKTLLSDFCLEFHTLQTMTCIGEYISTATACGVVTPTSSSPETCGIVNGVEICGNMNDPDATSNCVSVEGQTICDGEVAYGDCYEMQDGSRVCSQPITDNTTDEAPTDPTTGAPLQPDATSTTSATGSTEPPKTNNVYTPQTLAENNPYACDNPDTAVWEPCDGYCDNPSTVINECAPEQPCVDDPNTLNDESAICSAMQDTDCGGWNQPLCDALGNPVTSDTTAPGSTTTADGVKITDAINKLGDDLQGWHQPVISNPGALPQGDADSELAQAQQEYNDLLGQIKTELGQMVTLNEINGTLPCWTNLTIPSMGVTYEMCPRKYESSLAILGTVLLAIAALVAFVIVMR